jgi:hypothetical protein
MTSTLARTITTLFRILAHTRVPARDFAFWKEAISPASSPESSRPVHRLGGLDDKRGER